MQIGGKYAPNKFFRPIDIWSMKNPECIVAFGFHLRKAREKHGLSQQDIADKADIDKKTIQRIENGKLNPSLDTLASIAKGLNLTLKELLDFQYESGI